jgi:hypothetical protein
MPGSPGPSYTHLAVIEDEVELGLATQPRNGVELWIGLSDLKAEGIYLWVTDELVGPLVGNALWGGSGEPDGGMSTNCVKISGSSTSRFDDDTCSQAHAYVCECDLHGEVPANFDPP